MCIRNGNTPQKFLCDFEILREREINLCERIILLDEKVFVPLSLEI